MYLLKSILLATFLTFILNEINGQVVINEIQSSNKSSITDYQGDFPDWIELYNSGETVVNLNGYGLSDSEENLFQWVFPSISIEPAHYLLVFASDKNTVVGEELHANFKLSSSGESVFLTAPNATLVNKLPAIALLENQSYGRSADGAIDWIVYSFATPGASNQSGVIVTQPLTKPQVGRKAGFYDSEFSLELTCTDNGSSVFYSIDGNIPSKPYTQPLLISKSTVVKSACRKEGGTSSEVKTNTYFIGEEHDLPVVSLSFNPDDFYGLDSGIYVLGREYEKAAPNYGANFWEDWERKVHFEYFVDEEEKVEQDLGVKIFGGWSRTNAMKSLRLIPRSEYGNKSLDYQFFKDKPYLDTFDQLVLRNSGNDFNGTMWSDIQNHKALHSISDVDMMASQPVIVFFNGEYKGLHNLRERTNTEYLAANRDFSSKNFDFLEFNGGIELPNQVLTNETLEDQTKEGTNEGFVAMYEFITQNDMSIQDNYEQAASQLDIKNFIDYFAAQIYHINNDWPHNNIRYWRSPDYDGKWRYIYYDTEFGKGLYGSQSTKATKDELDRVINDDRNVHSMMFKSLLSNEKFRFDFINRSADFMNTVYTPTNFRALANELEAAIVSEMDRHLKLYGAGGRQNSLNTIYNFINDRPSNARGDYTSQFGHSQNTITLNVSPVGAGVIKISTIIPENYPWTGVYYNDVPVTITAIPNPGYSFSNWSGVVASRKVDTVILLGSTTAITASFNVEALSSEVKITEINYNSLETNKSGDWFELYNNGNATADLSGWVFRDSHVAHKFVFPQGTLLKVGAYLVVTQDIAAFKKEYPMVTNVIGDFDFGLGNSGDELFLSDTSGRVRLHLNYDGASLLGLADGKGATIELKSVDLDCQTIENWKANCKSGSPGVANIDCDCQLSVDLGNDFINCEIQTGVELKSTISSVNHSFYWYKGGELVANSQNYTATKSGEYELVVTEGTCMKRDELIITDVLEVNLGSGNNLCLPSSYVLEASMPVSDITYVWLLDSEEYSNESQIIINVPGKYKVTLSANGCSSVSDEVVFTTNGPEVENRTFCKEDSVATLEVNGAGSYEWFTQPMEGVSLGTNTSLILENLVSDSVLYVQDNSFEEAVVGRTSVNGTMGKVPQTEAMLFTVFSPMTLVAVSVKPQSSFGNTAVMVRVLDESDNLIKSVKTSLSGSTLQRVVLDLKLDPGNYKMDALGTSGNGLNGGSLIYENAVGEYPYIDDSFLSITGNSLDSSTYYYFYAFEVQKGEQGCERVPVYLTKDDDCLSTSVFKSAEKLFSVYPNPFSNNGFQVEVNQVSEYRIINLTGNTIEEGKIENKSTIGKNLVSGMYVLVILNDKDSESLKITKY